MAISRSDMERQLRKDGGVLTLEDAKRMAPPGESLAYINPEEAALLKSLGGAGEDINGTGIKSYFIKKIFKKAKRAVKKVVKSPLGKAAILGGLTFGIPGTSFGGLAGKGGLGSFFGKGSFNPLKALITKGPQAGKFGTSGLARLLGKFGLAEGTKLTGLGKIAGIAGLSGLGGLMAARGQEEEDEQDILDRGEGLDIDRIVRLARMNDPEFRFLPPAEFTGAYAKGGKVKLTRKRLVEIYNDSEIERELGPVKDFTTDELENILYKMHGDEIYKPYAEGGRINKAEGGIMNLGGMEMDLRGGGFVPLGAKEKADDVPARLSKNEFVMTADAVRAAGGGSVDKGADKMYKLMKGLEAQV